MSDPNKPPTPKVPGELAAALHTAHKLSRVSTEHISGPPFGEPTPEAVWDARTDREVLAGRPLPGPAEPKMIPSIPHPQRFIQDKSPAGR